MLNNVKISKTYEREVLHSTGNSQNTQSSLYDGLQMDKSGETKGLSNPKTIPS